MQNKYDARLKMILNEFEKINPQKFCTIMVDERGPENNSISIDGEEFLLEKDIDPMEFIKEYERKNKILFTKSNSITVIITNYSGK